MAGTKNIKALLRSMKPRLVTGEFVFCTIPKKEVSTLKIKPKMLFREEEGVTLILEKKEADKYHLKYESVWSLITLTVHSDLAAVGFLAVITTALAKVGISVNAVSAYYHDHLFVPAGKAKEAIKVLEKISSSAK